MGTPALNAKYAKRHAIAARTTGRTPPTQYDREGAALFTRQTTVFFDSVRDIWHDNKWGTMLQDSLDGTNLKPYLDTLFRRTL